MFDELYVTTEGKVLIDFLKEEYSLDLSSLTEINSFIDTNLKNLISIKIWQERLAENISNQYLNEIVSNLNQVIILGILGFKIPSYMLLRRSLENLMMFIYYKDHPIEFIKKENNIETRGEYNTKAELKSYMLTYPFAIIHEGLDSNKVAQLANELMRSWDEQYHELSNFVHGTSSQYLELNNYLDEMHPNDTVLNSINEHVQKFGSIIHALFILFFFSTYVELEKPAKSLIRNAIKEGYGYKRQLIDIYGEL